VLTLLTVTPGGAIAPASSVSESQDLAQEYWTAPSTPIQAVLSIDSYPPIGQPATLTCEISSILEAPGTSAQIELPATARLLDGDTNWQGDLLAGESIKLVATIAFEAEGDMAVFCRAHRVIDAENSWGDLAGLYLSIGQTDSLAGFAPIVAEERDHLGEFVALGDGQVIDDAAVQAAPPRLDESIKAPPAVDPARDIDDDAVQTAPSRLDEPTKAPSPRLDETVEPSPAVDPALDSDDGPIASFNAAPLGDLTITGRWRFYNRADNLIAEQMIVEIVRGDNSNHLAWCYTDVSGYYSCGPFTNPGAAGLRSRFLSYTGFSPYSDILVTVNPDWGTTGNTDNAFGTTTSVQTFSDGTHDIGSWYVTNGASYERAYWVTYDLIRVWKYIWFGTGSSQSPQETSGPSTVEWKIDSTHGTHYHPGGNIHLEGADPLSNTVVGHEYGHNIMYTVYGNWMPTTYCPSPHYVQLSSHVNCAWTEGWANFLPLAVNNDPVYRWASGSSLNLETPTWGTADFLIRKP